MIAVIHVGGHQALVEKGDQIRVETQAGKVGDTINLPILLLSEADGKKCEIGQPRLKKSCKAKIIEHGRGDKIKVFKMKPRKRYRRTQGHRQNFTMIEIMGFDGAEIKEKAEKPTASKEKTEKPAAKKIETKKPAAKKPVAKKAPAKKPAAKKPAAKKTTTKES